MFECSKNRHVRCWDSWNILGHQHLVLKYLSIYGNSKNAYVNRVLSLLLTGDLYCKSSLVDKKCKKRYFTYDAKCSQLLLILPIFIWLAIVLRFLGALRAVSALNHKFSSFPSLFCRSCISLVLIKDFSNMSLLPIKWNGRHLLNPHWISFDNPVLRRKEPTLTGISTYCTDCVNSNLFLLWKVLSHH